MSYSHNRHEVHLTGIPGRPGVRRVVIEGCETGREAVEVAENMYGGQATGSQAHWLRPAGSSTSGGGGGAGALGGLVVLALPLLIIGAMFGGGEKNEQPTYTPAYQAPVESTYTPQAPATPSWDNGPCVTANFEPC